MKTPLTKEKIAELEEKWLNRTITEEEALLYAQWYNDNQNVPLVVPPGIATSKEEHKQLLFDSISKKAQIKPKSKIYTIRTIVKMTAAAAVVLVMILTATQFLKHKLPVKEVNAITDFKPGKDGLSLQIGNIQNIKVGEIHDGIVFQQNNLTILKKNGALIYQGANYSPIQNKANTSYGQRYQIKLPDSTMVWINAGSTLTYTLPFTGRERVVELTGEGYFEVHKNPKQPFIVKSNGQTVKVLGTKFDIKAYPDENTSVTTLLEGKIVLTVKKNTPIEIKPGQQVTVSNGNNITDSRVLTTPEHTIGWVHGTFHFEDEPILTMMRQLQRWYNVGIDIKSGIDETATFSGNTPMNQNLSEVLKVLNLGGINCTLSQGSIIVKP